MDQHVRYLSSRDALEVLAQQHHMRYDPLKDFQQHEVMAAEVLAAAGITETLFVAGANYNKLGSVEQIFSVVMATVVGYALYQAGRWALHVNRLRNEQEIPTLNDFWFKGGMITRDSRHSSNYAEPIVAVDSLDELEKIRESELRDNSLGRVVVFMNGFLPCSGPNYSGYLHGDDGRFFHDFLPMPSWEKRANLFREQNRGELSLYLFGHPGQERECDDRLSFKVLDLGLALRA